MSWWYVPSYELSATWCQMTGTSKEDVEPADQRGREGGGDMAVDRTESRWTRPIPYI